jgi:type IV secretory pathway VirB10-like protein
MSRLPTSLKTNKRPAFNVAALYGIEGPGAEATRNQLIPTNSTKQTPVSGLYAQMNASKPDQPASASAKEPAPLPAPEQQASAPLLISTKPLL